MFRALAPSGCPIEIREVAKTLLKKVSGNPQEEFIAAIKEMLGVKHCFLVSSGKTALYLILKALSKNNTERNEVLIPAYTCYSVPSAIVKAGLKVRLCDVEPTTLDFDYNYLKKIPLKNVLAIVPSNLFGLGSDLGRIMEIAGKEGIFVVDDAAQSFGGTLNARAFGSFGDAGLFSLGRGKNITTLGGGIIVSNSDEIAESINAACSKLPACRRHELIRFIIESVLYSILLRPSFYWLPAKLPFLGLGKTVYEPDFSIERYSGTKAALGVIMLCKIAKVNNTRKANAESLRKELSLCAGVSFPNILRGVDPLFLRFPVLLKEKKIRDRVLDALKENGIGATTMYPDTVNKIPGIGAHLVGNDVFYGGQKLVDTLLTLPTHAFVEQKDIKKISGIISLAEEAKNTL